MACSAEAQVVELHHHAFSAFCAFLVGISSICRITAVLPAFHRRDAEKQL